MMASFRRISIVSLCMLYILQEVNTTLIRSSQVYVPFRLFDCFGFVIPVSFFVVLATFLVDLTVFRFGGGGGSGAGLITGEERKTEGDGIVMVSILITSLDDTLTLVLCDRSRQT